MPKKKLKLERFLIWSMLIITLIITVNAGFLFMIKHTYNKVVLKQEHRKQAMALVNSLRQETEKLTFFVRAYTSTSDTRYLMYYYDILAIREGKKPLPKNYMSGVYWDSVISKTIIHTFNPDDKAYSLFERMMFLNLSDAELLELDKVSAATDAMKNIEQIAFAATQGLYSPKQNNFVSDGEPRLQFANELVHSYKYNLLKLKLSESVNKLIATVDSQSNAAVNIAVKTLEQWIFFGLANIIIGFITLFMVSHIMRQRVLNPLKLLSKAAKNIARGDYSTRAKIGIRDKSLYKGAVEELMTLGASFNSMAQSIQNDITIRESVQIDLEIANKKSKEAMHAKSMFLANMSHEIRTPMNAIIGMAYLALQTDLTPRQNNYITEVHNAAQSLLGIINDILDFSKIEAGKMILDNSPFILEKVIGESLSLLRQRAYEKEIELLLNIANPLLLGTNGCFLGDKLRLGQIITNLLSNAIKFTHEGHIKLSVSEEERTDKDILLRFCLEDTGIGMTTEQVNGLFQEFTQADGSTTRKYGGTGLGLTISKNFVELMAGKIWVESSKGKGSKFIFTARFLHSKPLTPLLPLSDVATLRVLIVDDEYCARMVLKNLLTALGVGKSNHNSIIAVANAQGALLTLKKGASEGKPFDLVFVDWLMPDMDGGKIITAIQNSSLAHKPKTIMISASDSELMHDVTMDLNIPSCLSKPILPEALRTILNSVTNNTELFMENKKVQPVQNLKGMQVLLAEDNALNQQLAVALMEMQGIHVTVVNNGQEAVFNLNAVAPDFYHVVLMDLQMPVMDGYTAAHYLRTDSRYTELPIIAMTAHAMTEERERCIAVGMNDHISKPIEPDVFYNLLEQYYSQPEQRQHPKIQTEIETSSEIPDILNLDTTIGLRRAANDQKLYLKMLSQFTHDFSDYEHQFEHYITQSNWIEAERLAHTVKGLTGTLGISSTIFVCSGKLENACKNEQTELIQHSLKDLTTLLTPLLEKLQQFFTNEYLEDEPKQLTTPSRKMPDCLPQLLSLLQECDSDAIDLWDNSHTEFSQSLSAPLIQKISIAMQNFEFDTAYELLATEFGLSV